MDFEYYNVFENFSFYEAYSEGKNISDEILNISFRKDFSLIKWTHSKDSATVLFSLGVHSAVRNHPNRGSAAAAAKSLQSCSTLCDPRLRCPWDFPGKNTGVGYHCLLRTDTSQLEKLTFQFHAMCLTLKAEIV